MFQHNVQRTAVGLIDQVLSQGDTYAPTVVSDKTEVNWLLHIGVQMSEHALLPGQQIRTTMATIEMWVGPLGPDKALVLVSPSFPAIGLADPAMVTEAVNEGLKALEARYVEARPQIFPSILEG